MSRPRWDPDPSGVGVADATAWLPVLRDVVDHAGTPSWIAEQPDAHLLPHLRTRIEADGWSLEDWRIEADGVLVVDLSRHDRPETKRDIRVAVFALIGAVAEAVTVVRERPSADGLAFDVLLGMLPPDTTFASHGHTLRLQIARGSLESTDHDG